MNLVISNQKAVFIALALLTTFFSQTLKANTFNVLSYGALRDTTINSTEAFQKAIDACAMSGGGTVLVPAGQYLIGSIFLKSNVELHLAHGAIVFGSKNKNDYRPIKPSFVSLRTQEATIQLIYAEKVKNIALTGTGEINGQGFAFKKNNWNDEGIERPHLIRFINCEKIRVENLSLKNAACWMQHYLACEDVFIRGLQIFNHSNYNNDGIDIDGCKNVIISDILVDSDDDAIVLKSTSSRACENVIINNCIISSHCNALKLGTESNTGFRNIKISNCLIKPSEVNSSKFYGRLNGISGISLEMVDGGILSDIQINDISIDGTEVPLFIRLGERNRSFEKEQIITTKGILQNVHISNITANNAGKTGCSITGLRDNFVKNVQLRNIKIRFAGGGTEKEAEKLLPLNDYHKGYPEATMFGTLPAYGFYIQNVGDVYFKNIQLELVSDDARPAFHMENTENVTFEGIEIGTVSQGPFVFKAKNVSNLLLKSNRIQKETPYFLKVEGNDNRRILLLQNDFSFITDKVVLSNRRNKKAVTQKKNVK